jgi:hypothetical protein
MPVKVAKERSVEEVMSEIEKDMLTIRKEVEQGKTPETESILKKIFDFRMMWSVLSPPR